MFEYNPEVTPEVQSWLALDEAARMKVAESYHRDARIELRRDARKFHAAVHAIVETQLATAHDPALRALTRLMGEGLSRHEAIHAIGSIAARHVHGVMSGEEGHRPSRAQYDHQLDALTMQSWKNKST